MQTYQIAESKIVLLTNKLQILLYDEDDIFLSIIMDGQTLHQLPIPYPSGGYGGGGLLLSQSKKYLLFSYFSGESEEAFLLFQIKDCSLELLYESGYLYGENADYYFSEDESFLLQALRTGEWYSGEEEIDQNGNKFYKFGTICMLNIKELILKQHTIHVYPSNNWEEGITDNGPFQFSGKIHNHLFDLIMPWEKETISYPFKETIVIKTKPQ